MKVLFLTLPLLAVFVDPSEGGAPVLQVSPAGRKFCCNSQQEWYAFRPPTRVIGPLSTERTPYLAMGCGRTSACAHTHYWLLAAL
eukprot:COSAG01_NODE_1683_length_9497_cov_33.408172_5_plen_85_part_00